VKVNISADLVSTYIWRGTAVDQSPNIQPAFSLGIGNFTVGAWASSNFTGTFREIDLFASYAIKGFTITATDYIWTPQIDETKFFDYKKETTGHYIETSLNYKGPEAFPLTITAATMVYGADKKIDNINAITQDTTYTNYYSTYMELGYSFKVNGTQIDPFIGFTTGKGIYGESAGVINLGVSGVRKLKFNDTLEFPLKASLIFNPQASKAFIVLGITI